MQQIAKLILICLFLTNIIVVYSQTPVRDPIREQITKLKSDYTLPELTQKQMYEDFDYFVSIIKNCNPQYPVIKVITGYDMIEQILPLRNKIEDAKTTFEFIRIIKTALSYVLDGHCRLGINLWYHRYGIYREEVNLLGLTDQDFAYMFHYQDSVFRKHQPRLNFCYSDGKYCLKNTTTFYFKGDSIQIPSGSEVVLYNNQPVAEYIHDSVRTYYSCWDNERKKFYARKIDIKNELTKMRFLVNNKSVDLNFSHFKEDERIFDMNKFMQIHVQHFQQDSLLYIRLPLMSADTSKMKEQILQYKQYPIKTVMVDIRENYGGNDMIWEFLLSLMGGDSIRFHSSLIVNDEPEVAKRYPEYTTQRAWQMLKVDKPFIVIDDEQSVIENAKENLDYKGIIYILTDEEIFSSAGGFASLSKRNERIKTVGIPTGVYNGRGATPNAFVLPNSRLPFILSITLDDANISVPIDFLHDYVSYPLSPSMNYFKYYHNPQRPYEIDEKAMYEHDEIFKKTLEIIKNEK